MEINWEYIQILDKFMAEICGQEPEDWSKIAKVKENENTNGNSRSLETSGSKSNIIRFRKGHRRGLDGSDE